MWQCLNIRCSEKHSSETKIAFDVRSIKVKRGKKTGLRTDAVDALADLLRRLEARCSPHDLDRPTAAVAPLRRWRDEYADLAESGKRASCLQAGRKADKHLRTARVCSVRGQADRMAHEYVYSYQQRYAHIRIHKEKHGEMGYRREKGGQRNRRTKRKREKGERNPKKEKREYWKEMKTQETSQKHSLPRTASS